MTYPDFCASLHERLIAGLANIEKEWTNPVQRAARSADWARTVIRALEELLVGHTFDNGREEALFYKQFRPGFYMQLLYFDRVYQIELGWPTGDRSLQRAFLQREIVRLTEFFSDHLFVRKYLRSGATYLDEQLFFRPPASPAAAWHLYNEVSDPAVPSNIGEVVAQLRAGEMLEEYLLSALAELEPGTFEKGFRRQLTWTDSKAGLIELAYGLHALGAVNDGKAELNEIVEALEWIFQVRLRNYPRTFQEILARKTGYTNFLDRVREKLLLRIQQIEDRHIR
jgi:RteC protein